MIASKGLDDLEASGFFVLRSSLLPFDELRAWSDGLCAAASVGNAASLDGALAADRTR